MKHVLSMLLLLTALPAFAQKAAVERVASDPLNIAASKYPMTDLNGHTAPLVIVEVLTDNVEFKGNVLDGGVVRRTGEYWVYMGGGTKILRIQSGPDGRAVYITADQWQALSDSARSSYKPLGICLADTDNPFLVELHDKDAAKGMKWGKAMKFNLPTTGQGETILNNVENLNDALRVFGGTIMDNVYWTKEEKGTGAAWDILVNSGHLGFHSKISAIGVRPVAPCPR